MENFWNLIEKCIRIMFYKVFRLKLREERFLEFFQFLKFGIVGISNTFISYVVYIVFFSLGVHYILASVIGFLASVVNSFYWNNKYVFHEKNENRVLWKSFVKTLFSYVGTGLVLANILLYIWVDLIHIHELTWIIHGVISWHKIRRSYHYNHSQYLTLPQNSLKMGRLLP